ncbi:MAG: dienelactone hydrolase family protein [Rhodospirillales bacterium]|nr:dienelactone hydrolase family protein [Rhodospirillales bacterium]
MHRVLFELFVVWLLAFLATTATLPAGAVEKVHFEAAVLPPSPLRLRLAEQQGIALEPELPAPLWGYLDKPAGQGPFPAVVILHGCDGLPPGGPPSTAWLTEQGYVTLMVDSLGPRNLESGCFGDIGAAERVLDAYGAAAYLSGLPFVEGEPLAVMGWSQGGSTALDAVIEEGIGRPLGRPFRAAVAVSPWCGYAKALYAPILILSGEADEWTPARFCRRTVEALPAHSAPAEIVVYPGVHYGFTAPELAEGRYFDAGNRRFWLQYDDEAARDALARARTFLAGHLN